MFTTAAGSKHPVSHVLFHPNGTMFAVAQPNYGVTLIDRASGNIVGTVLIPRVADYSSILFIEGGARIVAGSTRGVTVCDTATGEVLIQRGRDTLHGALLAERQPGLIAATLVGLRDLQITSDESGTWLNNTPRVVQSKAVIIAISPCGRWGFGVYARVRPALLDIGTCRVAMTVNHPYCGISAGLPGRPMITFAPNGERFAVCDGNDVTVFDTPSNLPDDDEDGAEPIQQTGTAKAPKPRALMDPIFRLGRPEGVPASDLWRPQLTFTPDARALLIRRPRNRVQLWDVATGSHAGEWSWRLDSLTCLAIAPDGLTAVAGARFGHVVMWDLD